MKRLLLCVIPVIVCFFEGSAQKASHREVERPGIIAHFDEMPHVLTLPDGRLMALFIRYKGPGLPAAKDSQTVRARYSEDNGDSWGKEGILFTLPAEAGGFGYYVTMLDRDGEIHIFMLNDRGTGSILSLPEGKKANLANVKRALDIWHVKSTAHRTKWEKPKEIWRGRAGDLQSAIQCANGRIILPFSYMTDRNWGNRGTGADLFTYYGRFNCGVLYSDDGGNTWNQSPGILKTPVPDLSALGSVEPVVIELRDGRIWMLLRTQMGRFYESFSQDGSRWSAPVPSSILSSDSPAGLLRLADGRLLLFVNSCQRFPYAYGGRHVLHAAVSGDDGKTWRGYREVVRDPQQEYGPPARGDNGVSYPYPAVAANGDVIFSLWVDGTKEGRNIYRLDPGWLNESYQREGFNAGLSHWSIFGSKGVGVVSSPGENEKVMQLHKTAAEWPAAAVLNFPAGGKGSLKLRIMLRREFLGMRIGLTDHFSVPFDDLDRFHNLYNIKIDKEGILSSSKVKLSPLRGYELTLEWDCLRGYCRVLLDGKLVQELPAQRKSTFVNYLRLASTAPEPDQGVWLKYVEVRVDN